MCLNMNVTFVSGISQSNFCIFHNTTESVIIRMRMKLMKNKKYFHVGVGKSYIPFTCKFSMVMHFVLILHNR